MNAPAKIAPKRDTYIPQVRSFVPLCEGEDLSLRCSILLVRDQATAAMRNCSDEAYGVLSHIQNMANLNAYKAMPTACLRELRRQLVRLVSCASGLEMFAYTLSHPESGETDARG